MHFFCRRPSLVKSVLWSNQELLGDLLVQFRNCSCSRTCKHLTWLGTYNSSCSWRNLVWLILGKYVGTLAHHKPFPLLLLFNVLKFCCYNLVTWFKVCCMRVASAWLLNFIQVMHIHNLSRDITTNQLWIVTIKRILAPLTEVSKGREVLAHLLPTCSLINVRWYCRIWCPVNHRAKTRACKFGELGIHVDLAVRWLLMRLYRRWLVLNIVSATICRLYCLQLFYGISSQLARYSMFSRVVVPLFICLLVAQVNREHSVQLQGFRHICSLIETRSLAFVKGSSRMNPIIMTCLNATFSNHNVGIGFRWA